MKKLVILAATSLGMLAVNAATVSWSHDGKIVLPADGTGNAGKNITAARVTTYVLALSEAASGSVWDAITTTSGEGSGTTWAFKTTPVANNANATYSGGIVNIVNPTAYSVGQDIFNAIVIFDDVNANGVMDVGDYVNVAQGTYNFDIDTEKAVKVGLAQANWTQLTAPEPPSPTPEPTSGMLVLLGLAGLALKRKRA